MDWPRDSRCLIIAEVAQAHDGSLGTAHAYIDAAARAGADVVKFQTHIAEAESTIHEPWRVKFSRQDESRFAYWRRMEFTEEQWRGLREHADDAGIHFLSSPFSVEAVEMLKRVGVKAWKVASGEVRSDMLLDRMIETGLPILLSTGMSPLDELDDVVARIQRSGNDLTVFQCTTMYPTPPEKVGLNLLSEIRNRYGCKVGLSDHSGTIYAGLAAATLGANAIEAHVTFSRESFGPDVPASLTIDELEQLVRGVRFIETALANPVNKDAAAADLASVRALFSKSIVVRRPLPAGSVLAVEDLAAKKPGTGISAERIPDYVGRRTSRPLEVDALLREEDCV